MMRESHTQTQGSISKVSLRTYYQHLVSKCFLFQLIANSFHQSTFLVNVLPTLLLRVLILSLYYNLFLLEYFLCQFSAMLHVRGVSLWAYYHLFLSKYFRSQVITITLLPVWTYMQISADRKREQKREKHGAEKGQERKRVKVGGRESLVAFPSSRSIFNNAFTTF